MHTHPSRFFTRLLRGLACMASWTLGLALPAWGALTVNADGTVSDSTTSLVWDQCAYGLSGATCATGTAQLATWAQALTAAVTANTAVHKGYSDWRLPSVKELESITLIGNAVWGSPAIDATAFPGVPLSGDTLGDGGTWSSTSVALGPAQAYAINFFYGGIDRIAKTGANYVRLVRGGQATEKIALQSLSAQTITFDNPGALNLGTTHTLSATASSGLAPTFASPTKAVCTVTADGVLTPVAAGTCTITADQAGNATFDAAPQVTQSFAIEKNFQSGLRVSASADTVSVGGSVTLSTTGGSGTGAVTYASDTTANCTVSGNTLTGVAVGDCVIIAIKAGDDFYIDMRRKFGIAVVEAPAVVEPPPPTVTPPTIAALAVPPSCGLASAPEILNLGTDLGPAFAADMVTLLSTALGQTLSFVEQGVCGAVTLSGYNGGKLAFVPLRFQSGDARANGIYRVTSPLANGQYQVVRGGQSILLAPALAHVEQLMALLPGAVARQADNGVLIATFNGVTYAVQPAVQVQLDPPTGSARLVLGADGYWHFIDAQGNHQILYPAFADPVALRNALLALDTSAAMAIQSDGTAAIVFQDQRHTLVPDLTLSGVPSERVGQSAWSDGTSPGGAPRYRVVNNQPLGTIQSLTVRP